MRHLSRPSPAMVVACTALIVALSGTGYAATQLARNSVGAAQIRTGAVRSSEVRDRSLLARDFRQGELPRGATGEPGPRGPQGPAGPAGPATQATIGAGSIGPDQLGAVPAVRLVTSSPQAITSGPAQTFAIAEDYDPDDLHASGEAAQVTIRRAGLYLLSGGVAWAANATGFRSAAIVSGGATVVSDARVAATGTGTAQSLSGVVRLAAGDTAFLGVMQNSGAPLNLTGSFSATYLGR